MGSQFHSESHHTLGTSGTGEPWATPLYEGKPNCEMGCQQVLALSRSHLPSFLGKPRPCGLHRLMEAQPTLEGFLRVWWFSQAGMGELWGQR